MTPSPREPAPDELFFHLASDLMAVTDLSGTLLRLNAAWAQVLGFTTDEMLGKSLAGYVWPEDRDTYRTESAKAAAVSFTCRLVNKEGEPRPFRWQLTASAAEQCQVVVATDLSVRQRAEEALHRLAATLEAANGGIALLDPGHFFTYLNPTFAHLFGHDRPEDLLGKSWQVLYDQGEYARLRDQALPVLFRQGHWQGDAAGRRQDGGPLHVELALTALPNGGFVCNCRDITERKQAEERERRHQAELAHVARLCTLGEMATGIAHEINQPLAAVATYLDASLGLLAAGAGVPGDVLDAIQQAASQAQRAGEIVRRWRNLVRKTNPQRAHADLNVLVRNVLTLTQSELRQAGVRLHTELADRLPAVFVDDVQIEQVILNLVRNAAEALGEVDAGERELTVRTGVTADDLVEFAVRDTGRGLTPEAEQRLFEAFFTTKPNGLGLGLSISRTIIEAHAGRLWAERNPDRGATFHFTLPAER